MESVDKFVSIWCFPPHLDSLHTEKNPLKYITAPDTPDQQARSKYGQVLFPKETVLCSL